MVHVDNPIINGAAEEFWGEHMLGEPAFNCWDFLGKKITERDDQSIGDQILEVIEDCDDVFDLKDALATVFETSKSDDEFFHRLKIEREYDE